MHITTYLHTIINSITQTGGGGGGIQTYVVTKKWSLTAKFQSNPSNQKAQIYYLLK